MLSGMKRKHGLAVAAFLAVFAQGCTSYYFSSNLNSISPGVTKEQLINYFRPVCRSGGLDCLEGFIIRAAQVQSDGSLVEVGTVALSPDGYANPVEYWFLFKGGRLVQWGQPNDWTQVSGRYEINFNPAPAYRP